MCRRRCECGGEAAEALQREGQFDETTRKAWDDAHHEWVEVFGQMRFQTGDCEIFMEAPASESAMEQIMVCGFGACYVCMRTFEIDGVKKDDLVTALGIQRANEIFPFDLEPSPEIRCDRFEIDGVKTLKRVCRDGPVFNMQEAVGW